MAFFDFIKAAGEKLFSFKDADAASAELAAKPEDTAAKAKADALNRSAGDAIEAYIKALNLAVTVAANPNLSCFSRSEDAFSSCSVFFQR